METATVTIETPTQETPVEKPPKKKDIATQLKISPTAYYSRLYRERHGINKKDSSGIRTTSKSLPTLTNPLTGETHTYAEWGKILNYSWRTVYRHQELIRMGLMTVERAFTPKSAKKSLTYINPLTGEEKSPEDWCSTLDIKPAAFFRRMKMLEEGSYDAARAFAPKSTGGSSRFKDRIFAIQELPEEYINRNTTPELMQNPETGEWGDRAYWAGKLKMTFGAFCSRIQSFRRGVHSYNEIFHPRKKNGRGVGSTLRSTTRIPVKFKEQIAARIAELNQESGGEELRSMHWFLRKAIALVPVNTQPYIIGREPSVIISVTLPELESEMLNRFMQENCMPFGQAINTCLRWGIENI